jgi:TonB family protein
MKWVLGIVLFMSLSSYSQKTKFVLKEGQEFVEEYYVLETAEKIKSGTYVKYKVGLGGVSILESGNYNNGMRDGLWEFYYNSGINTNNSLKEKGNFVNDKKNGVWISYYFDTIPNSTTTQKHGNKKRTDSVNIIIEQNNLIPRLAGQFLDDKRVGEWTAFDFNGDIYQKYDFTNSRLISDISISDSLQYNNSRPPIYLGGLPYLKDQLSYEFNFRQVIELIKKDSTTVIVEFSITPSGKINNVTIIQSNAPSSMEKEVLRLITILDNNWIPAMQGDQLITSNFKIGFYLIRRFKSGVTTFTFRHLIL